MAGLLLGITGPARSGKGTVAGIVRDMLCDYNVVVEGFADRLKLSAAQALGIDGSPASQIEAMNVLKTCGRVTARIEYGPDDVLEADLSGREFLQRYGTESHRDVFGTDFWVDQVLPDPLDPFFGRGEPFDLLIIDDLRFPNEAKRIHECGGTVWKVERAGTDWVIKTASHMSEAGIPAELVHRTIANEGTLADLRDAVAEAFGLSFDHDALGLSLDDGPAHDGGTTQPAIQSTLARERRLVLEAQAPGTILRPEHFEAVRRYRARNEASDRGAR